MGSTGPCDSIKIIFGYHVNSQHILLNIKFGVNWMFHVLKAPVYRFELYGRYQILWTDIAHFQYQPAYGKQKPMCKFSSLQLFVFGRNRVYRRRPYGRTAGRPDRHSSNVLEFCADQMSPRNIWSQIIISIIISMCYKRIDKTNIPSLRRV